jgi:hypothetical protein
MELHLDHSMEFPLGCSTLLDRIALGLLEGVPLGFLNGSLKGISFGLVDGSWRGGDTE